jgi:hypothetical protein
MGATAPVSENWEDADGSKRLSAELAWGQRRSRGSQSRFQSLPHMPPPPAVLQQPLSQAPIVHTVEGSGAVSNASFVSAQVASASQTWGVVNNNNGGTGGASAMRRLSVGSGRKNQPLPDYLSSSHNNNLNHNHNKSQPMHHSSQPYNITHVLPVMRSVAGDYTFQSNNLSPSGPVRTYGSPISSFSPPNHHHASASRLDDLGIIRPAAVTTGYGGSSSAEADSAVAAAMAALGAAQEVAKDHPFSKIQRDIRERHMEIARRLRDGETLDLTGATTADISAIALAKANLDRTESLMQQHGGQAQTQSQVVARTPLNNNNNNSNNGANVGGGDSGRAHQQAFSSSFVQALEDIETSGGRRGRLSSAPLAEPSKSEAQLHNMSLQIAHLQAALQHETDLRSEASRVNELELARLEARLAATKAEDHARDLEMVRREAEAHVAAARAEAEAAFLRKAKAVEEELAFEKEERRRTETEFERFRAELADWRRTVEQEEANRSTADDRADRLRAEAALHAERRMREELDRVRSELERTRSSEASESVRLRVQVSQLQVELEGCRTQLGVMRDREKILQDEGKRYHHEAEAASALRDDCLQRLHRERERSSEVERELTAELEKARESARNAAVKERETSAMSMRSALEDARESRAALDTTRAKLDATRNEIEVLRAELERERSVRAAAQERAGFLAEDLERLRKGVQSSSTLASELELVRGELERERTKAAVLSERITFLAAENDRHRAGAQVAGAAQTDAELLRASLEDTRARLQAAMQDCAAAEARADTLDRRARAADNSAEDARAELERERAKQQALTERLGIASAELDRLRAELGSFTGKEVDTHRLQAAMSEMRQDLEQARGDCTRAMARAEESTRKAEAAATTNEALLTEVKQLRATVREKNANIEALDADLRRLRSGGSEELREETARRAKAEAELRDARGETRRLEAAVEDHKASVSRLGDGLATLNAQLRGKDAQIESLRQELVEQASRLTSQGHDRLGVELEPLQRKLREAYDREESLVAEREKLARQVARAEEDLRTEQASHSAQLRSTQEEAAAALREGERLRRELEAAELRAKLAERAARESLREAADRETISGGAAADSRAAVATAAVSAKSVPATALPSAAAPPHLPEHHPLPTSAAATLAAIQRNAEREDLTANEADRAKLSTLLQGLGESVARVEQTISREPTPRSEKGERGEKSEKSEKGEKAEKSEKGEKAEKSEKAEKAEKSEKAEKAEKSEKGEKTEKSSSRDKDREGKSDKAEKSSTPSSKDRDREKDRDSSTPSSKDRDREKEKEREREKEKEREREREKEKEKEREREKEKEKAREKEKADKEKADKEKADKEKADKDKEKRERDARSPTKTSSSKDKDKEAKRESVGSVASTATAVSAAPGKSSRHLDDVSHGHGDTEEDRRRREARRREKDAREKTLDPTMASLLKEGSSFRKHAERKAKDRVVWVSSKLDALYWRDPAKEKPSGSIAIRTITAVRPGGEPTEIASGTKTERCITIKSSDGQTLTLECKDQNERDLWLTRFLMLME